MSMSPYSRMNTNDSRNGLKKLKRLVKRLAHKKSSVSWQSPHRKSRFIKFKDKISSNHIDTDQTAHRASCVCCDRLPWRLISSMANRHHSARYWRKVELPVHPSTAQHERRWKAKDHVRLDQDQGCRASLLESGLQESRCRPEQAVGARHLLDRGYDLY